ncbi:MAG: sel1 repeat family protein, partial [Phycisphaerae bacterium]|nr:sel1 repeat family protein [Phycisphaerae bacterium]
MGGMPHISPPRLRSAAWTLVTIVGTTLFACSKQPPLAPADLFAQAQAQEEGTTGPANIDAAVILYERSAEGGNLGAMQRLVALHRSGWNGKPPNRVALQRWLGEAAKLGDGECALELAGMIARGNGISTDEADATRWYRLAAEAGSIEGALRYGLRL